MHDYLIPFQYYYNIFFSKKKKRNFIHLSRSKLHSEYSQPRECRSPKIWNQKIRLLSLLKNRIKESILKCIFTRKLYRSLHFIFPQKRDHIDRPVTTSKIPSKNFLNPLMVRHLQ